MNATKQCSFHRDAENVTFGVGLGYCDFSGGQTICDGDIQYCEFSVSLERYALDSLKLKMRNAVESGTDSEGSPPFHKEGESRIFRLLNVATSR